ncbi:hypothetical protein PINS_up007205 [Pythium insidiosum]|nr:hypothetical protein PINS_up007205 [Pythium insidiosum]
MASAASARVSPVRIARGAAPDDGARVAQVMMRTNADTAPAGSYLLPVRPFIPHRSLDTFNGKAELSDRRAWWKEFLYHAHFSRSWSDLEKCRNLEMYLRGVMKSIRKGVPTSERSSSRTSAHAYYTYDSDDPSTSFPTEHQPAKASTSRVRFQNEVSTSAADAGYDSDFVFQAIAEKVRSDPRFAGRSHFDRSRQGIGSPHRSNDRQRDQSPAPKRDRDNRCFECGGSGHWGQRVPEPSRVCTVQGLRPPCRALPEPVPRV